MNNLGIIVAIFFVLTTCAGYGQSVGNNRLIITGGFTPKIKDARKIEQQPQFSDTVYKAPNFNYSIINTRVNTTFHVRPIGAAKMKGERLDKIYKAYLMAGMGTYATPVFEFRYGMGRSRDQRAGIHLKHMSSAGKIKDYIYPGFSDNSVSGYFEKIYKKTRFGADVSYARNVRHYYGVNIEDTALINNADITDETNKQIFNTAAIKLSFSKYKYRKNEAYFDYKLGYYYIIDHYGTRENGVNYSGVNHWGLNLFKGAKNQRLGFTSKVDFYNDSDSLHIGNSYIIGLKPFYSLNYKMLDAQVGLKADVYSDSVSRIKFFPELKLKLDVIENVLNFVFEMYGGVKKNNFRDISKENPFVNSILPMKMSVNKFTSVLGMQSSISRFLNLELGMRYEKWENAPFYVTDTSVFLKNKFTFVYDDYDLVALNAGLSYHFNKKWNAFFVADYYVYNTVNQLYAWHKPNYDIKLTGSYNLGDRILIDAKLVYTGPSKAPVYDENGLVNPQTIKAWFDASLSIEYRYHKRLGIFLNLNNLAATRYYRWYNYPSYGFNLIGGISYIF